MQISLNKALCVLPHLYCCHSRIQQCLFIAPYSWGALFSPWLSTGGHPPVSEQVHKWQWCGWSPSMPHQAFPKCSGPWTNTFKAPGQRRPQPRCRGLAWMCLSPPPHAPGLQPGGASCGRTQRPTQPCPWLGKGYDKPAQHPAFGWTKSSFSNSVLASKSTPDYSEASRITLQVFPHLTETVCNSLLSDNSFCKNPALTH